MLQPAAHLRRTIRIGAAPHHIVFRRLARCSTAFRTFLFQFKWLGFIRPLGQHYFDHGWDYLAGFLNDHRVAHANIFARDLLFVVQRRTAHGTPSNQHRFQFGHRRQRARAADLHGNGLEQGLSLFGRVLVGNRPARRLGGGTALFPQCQRIEFNDRPIGFVIQLMPIRIEFVDRRHQIIMRAAGPNPFGRGKAQLIQPIEHADLGVRHGSLRAHLTQPIQEHSQRALGNDLGVEHLQRTRRRIARIGKRLLTFATAFLIELRKPRLAHEHLSTYLENFGDGTRPSSQPQRNASDGF